MRQEEEAGTQQAIGLAVHGSSSSDATNTRHTNILGVPRDVPTAVECFAAAAASPHETSGSAAYWLGHLYRIGEEGAGAYVRALYMVRWSLFFLAILIRRRRRRRCLVVV